MKKVLVAVDGSKNSNKALLKAKVIAQSFGSDIDILTVVRTAVVSPYITVEYTPVQSNLSFVRFGEEVLSESLNFFDDFDGEVNTILKSGDPAETIIKVLEAGEYDLLVMGSRGLGTFSRTMLGSVSTKVLNHTDTNVLIVK